MPLEPYRVNVASMESRKPTYETEKIEYDRIEKKILKTSRSKASVSSPHAFEGLQTLDASLFFDDFSNISQWLLSLLLFLCFLVANFYCDLFHNFFCITHKAQMKEHGK